MMTAVYPYHLWVILDMPSSWVHVLLCMSLAEAQGRIRSLILMEVQGRIQSLILMEV